MIVKNLTSGHYPGSPYAGMTAMSMFLKTIWTVMHLRRDDIYGAIHPQKPNARDWPFSFLLGYAHGAIGRVFVYLRAH